EVFEQTNKLERSFGKVIDGQFAIIHGGQTDAFEVFLNQVLDIIEILPDRHWTDLFVVANDHNLFAHENGDERGNIGLTGLVNDDDIETIQFHVKIACHEAQWHNPDGNGGLANRHKVTRLFEQVRRPFSFAFAHFLHENAPSLQGTLLFQGGMADLFRPCSFLDQFSRDTEKF